MPEFISEEIEVRFAHQPGPPTSFVWRGREYAIVEVTMMRRALDFRKPWFRRRHRDIYQVRVESGEAFELYFVRGPGRKHWVLLKQL